ncbi:MAG: hypothetical protein M1839_008933 [Geoglossum umbratile]|nr:MAG: hypothetical protein M1839_008933 [Geoglossum umbratile]
MKRYSSIFRRDKKESAANGPANGAAPSTDEKPAAIKRSSFGFGSSKKDKEKEQSSPASADHTAKREDISNVFNQYAQLIHATQRPLPTQTGNGTYIEQTVPSGLWKDLKNLGFKDVNTLLEVMKNKKAGGLADDKTYLMERVIQLVSGLPALSKNRFDLTNQFIGELWNSLQHPPLSYLGEEYAYRKADGSGNNIMYPHLGAANTPYARSVRPGVIQRGSLPDPGVIFDSVMAREKYTRHPNNVSSMLFYIASIIIHDLFRTDHRDLNMSMTSSYLDLSPLYGSSQAEQDSVRTFKDGKLKPDCFSEKRLLGFPPGVGCILISQMFNRFHNYVVDQLAVINEEGRFTKPGGGLSAELQEKSWAKYDNDLFQTGRLVTCGLYINIILLDYLRTIVNLNRSNTTWTLDPRVDMGDGMNHVKVFTEDGAPRGIGNQVSTEFNLLYRWHSAISDRDDKWTQDFYRELFPGQEPSAVCLTDLMKGLGRWEHGLDADPLKRPFAKLERQANGSYRDEDVVKILTASIEDPAGSFGANNVPKVLRAVEILGIQQARKWKCCSLNEFRKFFGLKPHETFEDINSDPSVAGQLRHLYEHPDFVELYPGLVSEEAKVPMVPGVGICPTFTVSRAILSDAVCLVRGDRFYTVDYHPKNLTNWGYSEVQYDLNVEQGCVFYKLFLRAFPAHFKPNSVYVHYPLTIPLENKKILTDLGRVNQYSWDKPALIPPRINLTSYIGAKSVLEDQQKFKVMWGEGFEMLMGKEGLNFMLSGDTPQHAKQRKLMGESLYRDQWHQQVKDFYEYMTLRLLKENSYKLAGVNQVDIIRDIGNLTHVHFAANVFSLPLKTSEHPHGVYSEHELYMVLAVIFVCIFFDLDPAKSFPLHQAAIAVSQQLGKLIEVNVKAVHATGVIAGVIDNFHQEHSPLKDYGVHMVRRLLASGLNVEQTTWSQILPTAGAMVANQAQVFAQVIDYYLSDEGKAHLPEINRLAKLDTAEADEKILHYAMEGIRMAGTFGLYRGVTELAVINDNGRDVHVKAGDSVFVSFVGAAKDPVVFPNPEKILLNRPIDSYIHYGVGPHTCLGAKVSRTAITAMLKTVCRLDGLRRAPGEQGQLKKIPRPGGFYIYMKEDYSGYFPFPTTMKLNFDGELPDLKNGPIQANGARNGAAAGPSSKKK